MDDGFTVGGAGIGGDVLGAVGNIGGQLIGGAFDMFAQNSANAANERENALNRSFQERLFNQSQDFSAKYYERQKLANEEMANTAYQRATRDMLKAGINPMLAYMKGGADTPTISSPTGGSAPSGSAAHFMPASFGAGIKNAVNTAVDLKRLNKEISSVDHQNNLVDAQAEVAKVDRITKASTAKKEAALAAQEQNEKELSDYLLDARKRAGLKSLDAAGAEADADYKVSDYKRNSNSLMGFKAFMDSILGGSTAFSRVVGAVK